MAEHLRQQHRINLVDTGDTAAASSSSPPSIATFMTGSKQSALLPLLGKQPFEKLQYLLIRWIVTMHIAFNVVENPFFRELLHWFNDRLIVHLPKSHNTIKTWMMDAFKAKKDEIRTMINQSHSNIHLSFDMWTSDNSLALLAICSHFIDKQYNVRTVMLALRRIKGSHSGENIAYTLEEVIKEYDVTDRLGYFVLDNAESDDTCVEALLQSIAPHLKKKHRRLRCMGHIINLAAQALLLGEVPKVIEAEIYLARALEQEQKELEIWRRRGLIGKLHNIVKYIRVTSQRREQFLGTHVGDQLNDHELDDPMVKSDNATRWNSADDMIERGLKLRRRIDLFCLERCDKELAADCLTNDEWQTLASLHDILQPFKKETINLQGRGTTGSYGSAWEVLPTIYKILKHTKEKQAEYLTTALSLYGNPEDHHIFHCLALCIKKLEKYQGLLSQSPIYAAATVMNSTKKWTWFTQQRPDYKGMAELDVQQIWNDFYKYQSGRPSLDEAAASNHSFSDDDNGHLDDEYLPEQDAYLEYCQASRVSDHQCRPKELVNWWQSHSGDGVSRMTWDTLAIPAMSAECERIFSSASRLVTSLRGSLQEEAIEANECLKNWYAQDIEK